MMSLDLANEFLTVIPKTMRSIRREIRKIELSELSLTEFRVLANLSRQPHGNTSLADEIGVSVPAMTKLIHSLMKRGFVNRTEIRQDRRKALLKLTVSGRKAFLEVKKRAAAHFAFEFEKLDSNQKETLVAGLATLKKLLPPTQGEK